MEKRCGDCGEVMEVGFIPDASFGAVWVCKWHPGRPDEKKSVMETVQSGSGAKYDKAQMRPIEAYRCTGCGRLYLYAVTKLREVSYRREDLA